MSTTEYAVLGLLAEQPAHGFAIAKQLAADTGLGRVFTVHRPLVYRALDHLVVVGYAAPVATEKGMAGPQRVILRTTSQGHHRLDQWLAEPVKHIRDLRIGFLLKLALLQRREQSPLDLIRRQKAALATTLRAIDEPGARPTDHVDLWRRHNAAAAAGYLDALEERHSPGTNSVPRA